MNRREKIIYKQAIKDEWEVLNNGYPDFLLYKKQTNEAIFIEVKSQTARDKKQQGGELTPNQERMHQILKNLGFTVKVVYIK